MTKKAIQASQSVISEIEYINLIKKHGYHCYRRFWSDTKTRVVHSLINADKSLAINDIIHQTNLYYVATQSAVYALKKHGLIKEAGKKQIMVQGYRSTPCRSTVKCYKKTDDLEKLWLFFQSQQAIKKETVEKRVKPLRNDIVKTHLAIRHRRAGDEVVRIPCINQNNKIASLYPNDILILSPKIMDADGKLYTFRSSHSLTSYYLYMLHHENDVLHQVSDDVYMRMGALVNHCTFEKRSFYHVLTSPVGDFYLSPLRWRNLKALCHQHTTQQAIQFSKQKQQATAVAA